MTVGELIEHLSLLPRDAEVLVCDGVDEGVECGDVGGVYLESYRIRGRKGSITTVIIAAAAEVVGTCKIRAGDDGVVRSANAV